MALNMTNVTFERRARETGGSALMLWAVARSAGSNILFASDPGAGAPGFTLPPASRARRSNVTFVIFNAIDLEKINELAPKRDLQMMLFLVGDVALHLFQV